MWGDSIFEMLRTFNRRTFKLDEHIDRLYSSAKYVGMEMSYRKDELIQIHENLLIENRNAVQSEFRSLINVSRGILPMYENILSGGTNIIITTFPLEWIIPDAFKLYSEGINVVIPNQRQISAQFLEPKIKNRSRLHYKMADLQAKKIDPDAWALLLDSDGFVAEGSGSNFFIVKNRELFTPEPRNILRGISRKYVIRLANKLRVEVFQRNIELYDICNADEAFFTNTPYCIVPVVRINGINIGNGKPGRLTKYLSFKWGEDVKYDWVAKVRKDA